MRARATTWCRWGAVFVALTGCEPERPPAPDRTAAAEAGDDAGATAKPQDEAFFEPGASDAILTYAGDRGAFADSSKPETVPDEAKGLVRVTLLEGPRAPAGTVWVANLGTPEPDGRFRLKTVPRDLFEELALGQGRSSEVELPEGLEPPEQVATIDGVIVYKTSWCGVCKKVEAYLARKGVDYEAKDIEKDRAAAAELQAKAQSQGVRTGSVPVIDVGGQLIVGFDRARLETLL